MEEVGFSVTVADARFCKPLDGDLIRRLANEHQVLLTVEEGSIGGFGSHVSHFLALNGLLDGKLKAFQLNPNLLLPFKLVHLNLNLTDYYGRIMTQFILNLNLIRVWSSGLLYE